mmetsp:Transcript_29900/g.48689  ORF Transcript_29900/g.48689 Transcript_29900/m.48689 type:complete len:676 (-) Transcript_29900:94-2121(-)
MRSKDFLIVLFLLVVARIIISPGRSGIYTPEIRSKQSFQSTTQTQLSSSSSSSSSDDLSNPSFKNNPQTSEQLSKASSDKIQSATKLPPLHIAVPELKKKEDEEENDIISGDDSDGVSGIWRSDIGYVIIHPDHGVDVIRPKLGPASGLRGTWTLSANTLSITWHRHGRPVNRLHRRGNQWTISRGGEIGSLSDRQPLSPENMKKIFNFGIRIDTSKFHNENDDSDEQKNNNVADSNDNNDQQQQQLRRPYMLYMGKCCEEHWELSYTPRCRDSPGCSSKPGIAYDNTGTDLYHPSVSCEVECVVHHDPQAPIDVVLTGGYVNREDYYADINYRRSENGLRKKALITPDNRPIAASLCLEPFWRVYRRAKNPNEMKMVDMLLSTNLNADIPVTRFSLLRLETNDYDWDKSESWVHWQKYALFPENQPPKLSELSSEYLLSVVIGHCDGPADYPKGYGNRLNFINKLKEAGLPVYLTGRLNRCSGARKMPFWANSKRELIRKYKFHLSVENCDEKDWVTEKLYQTLMAGVVPVYVGSPNVFEFIPREMMVVAADYKNPEDLVHYLKYLGGNDTAYEEIRTAWRISVIGSKVHEHLDWTFNHSTANAFCSICRHLKEHESRKKKSGKSWGNYWQEDVKRGSVWTLSPDKGWIMSNNGEPVPITTRPPGFTKLYGENE